MEQIIITKRNGKKVPLQNKGAVIRITKAEQHIVLLGEDVVKITIQSPIPQTYEIGDKITVFGREYTMNLLPKIKKKGAHLFEYDLCFEGVQYDLSRAQYSVTIDTTGSDVQGDSLMADLRRFMEVLIANVDRVLPGQWKLGVCPDTDTRNITFNCENCLAVLQRLCQEFDQEFEITQLNGVKTINIKKAGTTFPYTFQYGKGRGIYDLSRENVSTSNIVTRLKVFGGSNNLGSKYRNDRLCLPGKTKAQSFIEDAKAIAQYGIWEDEKHFDDIHPRFNSRVTSKGDSILKFKDSSMTFDLNEKESDGKTTKYLINGVAAKIKFNTGGLAGYEFDIHSYDHATKTFVLKRLTDERGMTFPSETSSAFQIKAGDEYALLDINLPQNKIDTAEKELAQKGPEYLAQNCQPKVCYNLTIVESFLLKFVGDGSVVNIFMVGDYIHVVDDDLNVDKSIRITGFTRDLINEYKYKLTIADTVEQSIYNRIISDLIDIDKIIQINDLADPSKARRKWMSAQEILGMIFDPEGDYYTEKIKPGSIETLMLSVGAKSMQFMLQNTMFEANYNGNKNLVNVTGGVLTHLTIEKSIRNWNLSTASTTLTKDETAYYIYAKCQKAGDAGSIIFSTSQMTVNEDPMYYHFWVGVLHSVVDGVRAISLTYGSTTINGKFIRTGQIESSDGSCVFNLDGNSFKMGDASCSLEWNRNNDRKLRLKGTLIQSPGGTESPLGVWCGPYVSTTIYYPGDEVSFTANGVLSSFRRIGEGQTKGISPSNTAYWQLIAQGSQGSQGTNGNWVSYVFKQSTTRPATPTGTSSIPSGWSDAPTSTGKWWMSKATISGATGLAGTWSTPIQVTAEDGVDGAYTDFKYKSNTSLTDAPALSVSSRNPSGWSDTPPILTIGQYLWFTQAQIDANDKLIGTWSTPVRISGEKGNQGDKGDPGEDGYDGPAIVFRGQYSSSKSYYGNMSRIDVVKYNNIYYKAKKTAGIFSNKLPTNTIYWENFGAQFESVATELLLAESANIANFIFRNQRMESQGSTSGVTNIILDGLRNVASFAAGKVKFENDKALIGWLQVVGKDLVGYDENNKERIKITSSALPRISSLDEWVRVNFKSGSSMSSVTIESDDGELYATCPGYRSEIRDPWNDRVDYEEENNFVCYTDFTIDEDYSEASFDAQCGVSGATIDRAECFLDVYAHNGTSYSTKVASGKFSDPINVMLNKGKYRALFTMYAYSSRDWRGTMYIGMQDLPLRRRAQQTIIGKDGLLVTANGNYLKMQATEGFEVKIGNYGIRINSSNGIQKTTNNGSTWSSL